MNDLLYNPTLLRSYCGKGGRVIIFAFARAPVILMERLMEAHAAYVNNRACGVGGYCDMGTVATAIPCAHGACRRKSKDKKPLADICIVALPLPDNIGSAGTSSDIEAHEKATGNKVGEQGPL
jgi:hypothetical protein